MSSQLNHITEILLFVQKMIGLKRNIFIDSSIFRRSVEDEKIFIDGILDVSKDIIKIHGSKKKPISVNDILRAFNKMDKQFNSLKNLHIYRCITYEGIRYMGNDKYLICWGT